MHFSHAPPAQRIAVYARNSSGSGGQADSTCRQEILLNSDGQKSLDFISYNLLPPLSSTATSSNCPVETYGIDTVNGQYISNTVEIVFQVLSVSDLLQTGVSNTAVGQVTCTYLNVYANRTFQATPIIVHMLPSSSVTGAAGYGPLRTVFYPPPPLSTGFDPALRLPASAHRSLISIDFFTDPDNDNYWTPVDQPNSYGIKAGQEVLLAISLADNVRPGNIFTILRPISCTLFDKPLPPRTPSSGRQQKVLPPQQLNFIERGCQRQANFHDEFSSNSFGAGPVYVPAESYATQRFDLFYYKFRALTDYRGGVNAVTADCAVNVCTLRANNLHSCYRYPSEINVQGCFTPDITSTRFARRPIQHETNLNDCSPKFPVWPIESQNLVSPARQHDQLQNFIPYFSVKKRLPQKPKSKQNSSSKKHQTAMKNKTSKKYSWWKLNRQHVTKYYNRKIAKILFDSLQTTTKSRDPPRWP